MSVDEKLIQLLRDYGLDENPKACIAILRATLMERERCAKVAEDALDPTEGARVAESIRKGK